LPIVTSFSLSNAPIVLENDTIPTTGGVAFKNATAISGSAPFTITHPAFTKEIEFSNTSSPARPGEYSVNYNTGEVLVFGETIGGDGTGTSAPVADYFYRNIFTLDLDYTFDSDTDELAVKSSSNLGIIEAKITFNYEDVFAEGTDFRMLSHVESLNERVNNKLISSFVVETNNFPITDVFRIFNETTGEIYTLERFNDTSISFSGRQAPRQVDITRERVSFARVPQEVLLVSDELTNSSGLSIFKIDLSNSGITDSRRNFIGASYDTSALFSKTDIRETDAVKFGKSKAPVVKKRKTLSQTKKQESTKTCALRFTLSFDLSDLRLGKKV